MTMSYQIAKAALSTLESQLAERSSALKSFPRGPLGLTPDAIKFSAEYRAAKSGYDAAFTALRAFNARFTRQFAAEIKAERRATRA